MKNNLQSLPVQTFSWLFLRHFIVTMRPYLLFVSGATGIIGIAFSPATSVIRISLVYVASFLSYGFGQALTDCFQIDTDTLSSPYRPLTRGFISPLQVGCVSVLGLILCIAIFAYYNTLNIALGIISGLGLATYTPFKKKWWSGPFYNAWIVGLLCTMAFLAGGGSFSDIISPPYIFIILGVFFGYANFVLSGYFKDIEADRQTDYRTLPVVHGRLVSAIISDLFTFLFLASIGAAIVYTIEDNAYSFWSGLYMIPGIVAAVVSQIRLHQVRSDEGAHMAIAPVVHRYILMLSGLSLLRRPSWFIPISMFYGLFILVMKIRPAKQQI